MAEVRTATLEQVCTGVDAAVESLFARVEAVRRDVLDALGRVRGRPRLGDLAALEVSLRQALEASTAPRPAGLGYIAEVGVLEDAPRWLEWVRRTEAGALVRLEPDLDPDSFGYYDFTAAAWFRRPLATGVRSVVGPYVDFAGTDEYVVTLTVPVRLHDRVLGVAGADLRPEDLAEALMPELRTLAGVALVNADGRVVVSTSPRWQVGALVRDVAPRRAHRCRSAPWSLLELEPPVH